MTSTLLELESVGKFFDNVEVFSGFSIRIDTPGVVAIIGPSGSGKTTLLRIIAGLLAPTSGHVRFHGQTIVGPDPERVLIFQQYALFPWATARENLEFGLRLSHNRKKAAFEDIRKMANSLLDGVGLSEFGEYYSKNLSGGMQQRIALARALALSPDLLLMDEPFGALDSVTRLTMHGLLRKELASGGRTAILVTHDVDDAIALAHTIYVLSPRPATIVKQFQLDRNDDRNTQRGLSTPAIKAEVLRTLMEGSAQGSSKQR